MREGKLIPFFYEIFLKELKHERNDQCLMRQFLVENEMNENCYLVSTLGQIQKHSQFNNMSLNPFPLMDFYFEPQTISKIIASSSAPHLFTQESLQKLALMVEMETRKILQSACKYMSKARRDIIQPEDVFQAVKDNGHQELSIDDFTLSPKDEYFRTQDEQFQEEVMKLGALSIQEPYLDGKWIFVGGRIPKVDHNIGLKCLSQMHDKQEQKKTILKVIKDDPLSLLTNEQMEYFQMMGEAIRMDVNPRGEFTVEGDLNNLLPFFLKFLGEKEINSTGIHFLLKLVNNPYIWTAIQYYLKQVLALLLSYRGEYSFTVGQTIASLVQRFQLKYPALRDIFVGYKDDSYSTIIKQIPMELTLGIAMPIDMKQLQRCRADMRRGDMMAGKLMQALLFYSSELKHLKELMAHNMRTFVYWHPSTTLKADPFLSTL